MDDQTTPALAQSSAVRAFEDLRGEVSLLRRAIEGLTAERANQPDYGPTLEALVKSTEDICGWAQRVSERPALQLTPRKIGEQIDEQIAGFRDQDRKALEGARGQLVRAVDQVMAISAQVRTSYEQARLIKIVGGVCFLCGFVLGPFLAHIRLDI